MSKVWRARDMKIGRVVCLKLLDKAKTQKFEMRFTGLNKPHEGAICMALRHKNIVQTFEFGISFEDDHCPVIDLIHAKELNYLIDTKSQQLQRNPKEPQPRLA